MLDHGLHALLNRQHKRNTTMKNLKAWNNKNLRLLILLTGVFLMGAEGCDDTDDPDDVDCTPPQVNVDGVCRDPI